MKFGKLLKTKPDWKLLILRGGDMDAQELKDMNKEQMIFYLQNVRARGTFWRWSIEQLRDSIIDNYERDCYFLHSELQ